MDIAKRVKEVAPSLTLALSAKANKLKAEGLSVISFGVGEPDFNTPSYIVDAAKEALDKGITKYTAASGTPELRKAICQTLKIEQELEYTPSQIVVSNGAKHSLSNACMAIVNAGDEVIIPTPYWLSYPEMVRLCEGVPVFLETKAENSFKLSPKDIEKAITKKTKAIFLNNPSNPTGVVYTKEEIIELAKVLEKTDIYIISDEIYDKLSYEHEIYSIARYSEKIKNQTILINGVSKSYAMTGWRIGYSAANPTVSDAMANIQSHQTSNPNSVAQYATKVAITDPRGKECLNDMKKVFNTRRLLMLDEIKKVPNISVVTPSGAFYVMFDISKLYGKEFGDSTINSANDFALTLLSGKNVSVIPCESFGANDFIRLSYATSENDIKKGIALIKEFVEELK